MSTKQTEALKLALEALDELKYCSSSHAADDIYYKAITTIREALAEQPAQQQEPVGEVEQIEIDDDGQASAWFKLHDYVELGQLLYTSPPASKPLTDEQINRAVDAWFGAADLVGWTFTDRMRAAIAAAHGIKGDA